MNDNQLKEMTFTASQAAKIADLNPETLRVWRRRKKLLLEGEREGWTRFTYNDVMQIAVYNRLVKSNCTTELAEAVTTGIVADHKDQWNALASAKDPVFCMANMTHGLDHIEVEFAHGHAELTKRFLETSRSPTCNAIYQVFDCTKLISRAEALAKQTAEEQLRNASSGSKAALDDQPEEERT